MALIAGLGGLLAAASPATAQDEPTTEVRGQLKTTDADGVEQFLEGVELVVTDSDGNEIGVGVTDAEGNWSLEVPGAGTYSVLLREDTLPEGNSLRDGAKNPTSVNVKVGESRATLFAFGERQASSSGGVKAVQLFVDGIKLGLIIAITSVGLSLVFGTTGLTNFAHGEMVTFGAMVAYLFNVGWGWWADLPILGSLIFAAIIATLLGGVAGGLFNQTVWKPLRTKGASLISALVVSIGFSILIRYVIVYFSGAGALYYRDYQLQSAWDLGLFRLVPKDAVIMGLSMLILLGVAFGLERTKAGKAMRAVADNRDLAESSGIDVESVIRGVWIIGSALAALGGVFFGLTESVGWEMGFRTLLLMFAGVTLGGLGTAYGALYGSLIIGVFIQMSTLRIGPWPGVPSELKNVGALVILIVILLVRPQGLLGRAQRIG